MRILFIQLPLVDHSWGYLDGNVPSASASIGGYLKKRYPTVTCDYLPQLISGFGSDNLIVKYCINTCPDVVAFTSFLWNIERNLDIAREIKLINNHIRIVFGGSEIQIGSIALKNPAPWVDYFVIGEGEWFFSKILENRPLDPYFVNYNSNIIVRQSSDELIPADDIFEPFTGNELQPMPDGSAFIEYMRGCPYRCNYCFYSKAHKQIREIPFQTLLSAVQAKAISISELYILAPSLNRTKDFREKLQRIAESNRGIRLHSEMRTDMVDDEIADLMHAAGFRSLEVGLQTVNEMTLEKVSRKSNINNELRGMRILSKRGIQIKIGVIPGLPGDTLDSFMKTIDRLVDEGFEDSIELYPLMLLPGTLLRENAEYEGVSFLMKPPYYYNGGWQMSYNDILDIQRSVEERTGLSHWVRRLPDFSATEYGLLTQGVRFDGDALQYWDASKYQELIQTNVFSFHITITKPVIIYERMVAFLKNLPKNELFNIILYSELLFDEKRILELLYEVDDDHFYQRLNLHNDWFNGLRFHVYQVYRDYGSYSKAKEYYTGIVPIIQVSSDNHRIVEYLNDDDHILVGSGILESIQANEQLHSADAYYERIAFQHIQDHERFLSLNSIDIVRMPYEFRIISVR